MLDQVLARYVQPSAVSSYVEQFCTMSSVLKSVQIRVDSQSLGHDMTQACMPSDFGMMTDSTHLLSMSCLLCDFDKYKIFLALQVIKLRPS